MSTPGTSCTAAGSRWSPIDFTPNWADRPRKGKFYPGAEVLPAPAGRPTSPTATVQRGTVRRRRHPARSRCHCSAGCCCDSYGADRPPARRPGQHRPGRAAALHARQLVPWRGVRRRALPDQHVLGLRAAGPLTPGVYHYSVPHHALQRLLTGDVSDRGARGARPAALAGYRPVPAARRQVLAERLQVQQLQLPRRQHGRRRRAAGHGGCGPARTVCRCNPRCGSTNHGSAELLGVRGEQEGHLRGGSAGLGAGDRAADRIADRRRPARRPPARGPAPDQERSRTVITFDPVRRMQAATAENARPDRRRPRCSRRAALPARPRQPRAARCRRRHRWR